MKTKILLVLSLLSAGNFAFAENGCPDGMTPFQNGNDPVPKCYPIQGGQNAAPAQPQGRWLTRWGAIAADTVNGFFAGVNNFPNKRRAEKAALAQCKANGGTTCKVKFSYYNQCGVIAWGDSAFSPQSAENVQVASGWALEKCKGLTANCKIVYADCSLPVWVE